MALETLSSHFQVTSFTWIRIVASCKNSSFPYVTYQVSTYIILPTVWPDFAKFRKNLEIFGIISKVYLIFVKVVNPLWDFLFAFGQNFTIINGQILKKQSGHLVTLTPYAFTYGSLPNSLSIFYSTRIYLCFYYQPSSLSRHGSVQQI